jgi:hypothetical protein
MGCRSVKEVQVRTTARTMVCGLGEEVGGGGSAMVWHREGYIAIHGHGGRGATGRYGARDPEGSPAAHKDMVSTRLSVCARAWLTMPWLHMGE